MEVLRGLVTLRRWRTPRTGYEGSWAGPIYNAAAVVVPALLVAAFGWWSWAGVAHEATQRVEHATASAADHARRMFETQDLALEAALSRVRGIQPEVLRDDAAVHDFLKRIQLHTLSSSALNLVDIQRGTILASSTSVPPPDVDLLKREYIAFHRNSRTAGTHVGEIVRGASTGRAGFTVSRRNPDSVVAAVTMIALDSSSGFYRGGLQNSGDTLILARDDGSMLGIPSAGEPVESRLAEDSPLMVLLHQKGSTVWATFPFDNVERLWSQAKVGDYPVNVLYGLDASTLRAEWLSRFVPFALLAVLGSGLLLLAGLKAQRASAAHKLAEREVEWVRARAHHAEAMRESEARFRVLFEELPLPAWVIEPSSLRILDCNQRAADLLGFTQSQMRTMRVTDFDVLYSAAEIARNEERIAKDGRLTLETKHRAADGSIHDMLVTAHSVSLGGCMLTYANGIDITDRKRAEEKVREADDVAHERLAELEQIFRYSPVGLFTLDRDLRYVKVNRRLADLNGLSAEDHVGRTVEDILGDVGARAREQLERILKSGEPLLDVEMTIEGHAGPLSSRHFLCSWYPFRSSAGEIVGIAGAVADISEQKRSEMHNRLLMQEVNHRAKNMLSVIQAIARNTARTGDPATFMERLGERIRGLAACQDLLVSGSWRGIDLEALVRSQLVHFADLIGKRIKIEGPTVHISAAAAQAIGMAIHELCTNAGKYGALSQGQGSVSIKWSMNDDTFEMEWCESGGPRVKPPERRGFGHTVIETMAASALRGKARLDYSETGVCWFLTAPAEGIADVPSPDSAAE